MTSELDPSLQQRIISLAEAYPAKWEEVIDGRTEARSWFIGMTAFGLEEEIDRKAVQAWIDGRVDWIRHMDAYCALTGAHATHSRLPQLTTASVAPEDAAPLEDVVAMAVVEGTAAEFLVSMPDKARGNHDDPDKHPRAESRIDTSDPDNLRVIDVTRTQLLPDGSLSIETAPVDPNGTEDWVTIDMKGPPVDPFVAISKTKLTELLKEAWSHGNSCEGDRYGHVSGFKEEDVSKLVEGAFAASDNWPTTLDEMTPEQRKQVEGMFVGYVTDDAYRHDVSERFDSLGLKAGSKFDLPPGFKLRVKPGDFKPIPGENPEIDYDQLGGWLYEIISSVGVCTYDEARPARPFHLDEAIAPFTDGGTRDEAEHIVAKAIDRGLEKFKDRVKLPDVDVQAYKTALAFEPD